MRRELKAMKYVILIHSNPQPWGHPTGDYLAAYQELPDGVRERLNAEFEQVMSELQANGELLGGEALGDPAAARLYRWQDGNPLASDGPYSEAKEHLAGFFRIDVESQARAEEVAAKFAGPEETVELRPAMWPGGDDQ
ncbi:YciI family protein [Nonomuraea purpurea]|uniref:YciI family protein n=1 Tax=Nonomuraea purpurea TaxID=1849276 RepID=A0ABV8G9L5_9ACTN